VQVTTLDVNYNTYKKINFICKFQNCSATETVLEVNQANQFTALVILTSPFFHTDVLQDVFSHQIIKNIFPVHPRSTFGDTGILPSHDNLKTVKSTGYEIPYVISLISILGTNIQKATKVFFRES
jgi:hypothetical protein